MVLTAAWTIRPDLPDAERTVESLCHEWHVTGAKMRYDLECLGPERGDDESNAVMDPAIERRSEVEAEINERTLVSIAECDAVARVLKTGAEERGGEIDHDMLDVLVNGIGNMAVIAKGGTMAEATVKTLQSIEERRLERARAEEAEPA